MKMHIYFDMDGTIAGLYDEERWLERIVEGDETPYKNAAPIINMNILARQLNRLQKRGYRVGIISWLAKGSTTEYDSRVIKAKKGWLRNHLKSVRFDYVNIVKYGTPKSLFGTKGDILFDDEERNRKEWETIGMAYDASDILEVLRALP